MKKIDKLFFKTKVISKGRCNHCSLGFFHFPPLLPWFSLLFSHLQAIVFLIHAFLCFCMLSYLCFTALLLSDAAFPAPLIYLNKPHCKNSTCVLQVWFEVWDLSEIPLSFSIENSKYFKDMLLSSCSIFSLMTGQQDFPSRLESVGS